jgi:hypothetical protein
MSLQGSMTVERMCELVRVSRASFYLVIESAARNCVKLRLRIL